MSMVMNGDEESPWSSIDESIFLTGQTDSRSIYKRH
jgi:hypothetical protein